MGKPCILVVDDELDNRVMMRYFLESWGYAVSLAADGQEALEKVSVDPPALVLLDLEMPVMNGFEACDKLKSNPETEHIPIIMFTGLERTEDKVKGIRKGADDYVVKTVDPEELQARIEMILRRARRPATQPEPADSGSKALSGSLNDLYFPEAMQLIVAYGKSGVLRLTNGPLEGRVYLNDGHVVHAELETKVGEEAFYEMALWRSGRFSFQVGPASAQKTIHKSATNLLLEATRRLDEWNLISTKIPSFAEMPSRASLGSSAAIRLSRLDWAVLALANGERSIQALIDQLGVDPFEVGRSVFGLVTVGALTLGRPKTAPPKQHLDVPEFGTGPAADQQLQLTSAQWEVIFRIDGRSNVETLANLAGLPAAAVNDMIEDMARRGWIRLRRHAAIPRASSQGSPAVAAPPRPVEAQVAGPKAPGPRIRAIGLD